MIKRACLLFTTLAFLFSTPIAVAGIDHRVPYDNSGIWARDNQKALMAGMVIGEVAGGIWEGGETRLGATFWRAIDSSVLAGASTQILKVTFTRSRPAQTENPNEWFQGSGHYSFPSGEVAGVSSIITPFVLEYRQDDPWVYALELVPLYDSIARMKVWGHWQTDVLAGWALGTYSGYLAMKPTSPIILTALPHGVSVGLRYRW